jgi:ATP-dependent Zn protease
MLVDSSYKRAITLLTDNLANLHNLSESLIEKENLTGAEVDEIISKGKPLPTSTPPVPPTVAQHASESTDVQA